MVNGGVGDDHVLECLGGDDPAGVGVAVVVRGVAARNVESDAVTGQEHVRGDRHGYGDFVDLTGGHQLGLGEAVAVAQPQDSVAQVDRAAVGEHGDELWR